MEGLWQEGYLATWYLVSGRVSVVRCCVCVAAASQLAVITMDGDSEFHTPTRGHKNTEVAIDMSMVPAYPGCLGNGAVQRLLLYCKAVQRKHQLYCLLFFYILDMATRRSITDLLDCSSNTHEI